VVAPDSDGDRVLRRLFQQGAAGSSLRSPALNRSSNQPPGGRLGEGFGLAGRNTPACAWGWNPRPRMQAGSFFVSGERQAVAGTARATDRHAGSYGRPDFRIA
jgi:hypothetical protein